ncbi:PQQ-binding-like beta-propeller repeat protein [Planctomycetota bacterium]
MRQMTGFSARTTFAVLAFASCAASLQAAGDGKASAGQILETPGLRKGLCVVIEDFDGPFVESLHDGGMRLVHAISSDRQKVEAARGYILKRKKYGPVAVDCSQLMTLPYADSIANTIIIGDFGKLKGKGLSVKEIMRMVAPLGKLFIKGHSGPVEGAQGGRSGPWTVYTRKVPAGMDEWTHFEHDARRTSVSKDRAVGPPSGLRWVSQDVIYPSWGGGFSASPFGFVSGSGRNFYWYGSNDHTRKKDEPAKSLLVCRDAFNGLLLWKKEFTRCQHAHSLIAAGDLLFVHDGGEGGLKALNAATGQQVRTFKHARNVAHLKGELLFADGVLVQAANGVRAMSAADGKLLWEKPNMLNGIDMLLVGDGRVYYLDLEAKDKPALLVCCDLKTGKEYWRKTQPMKFDKSRFSKALSLISLHRDMIIMGSGSREEFMYGNRMFGATYAVSVKDGGLLWTYEYDVVGHKGRPTDVFPIKDSIWVKCRDEKKGFFYAELDAATGKEKQKIEAVYGRCYGDHATTRYILTGGMDFLDTKTGKITYFGAARGTCDTGFMAANSLTYAFPIRCLCFNTVRGFLGLHSVGRDTPLPAPADMPIEKGPAFGKVTDPPTAKDEWPALRHDGSRSSRTASRLGRDMGLLWKAQPGSRLSSPVVAGGMVLVADIDNHGIIALDSKTGETAWTFTAGGRIDSPPTVAGGMAVFGSADGRVYGLRAADGELVWRLRAAPLAERIVVNGQIESTWPVHGSVLVLEDSVYFAAGRNTKTDGGLYCYGVDLKSGQVQWCTTVPSKVRESNNDVPIAGAGRNSNKGEPVITIGHRVHLDVKSGAWTGSRPASIFSPWGMLRDCTVSIPYGDGGSDIRRRMWSYGPLLSEFSPERPGFVKAKGHLLAIEGDHIFGVREEMSERGRVVIDRESGYIPSNIFCQKDKTGKWAIDLDTTLRKRSLVITGDSLLFAFGSADGKRGGVWHLSKETGEKLGETDLPAAPRWDGLAVSAGKLFVVTDDGNVLCFGPR